MSRQKQLKTRTTKGKLDSRSVHWTPEGSHPSQVSGMFEADPTFKEFCEILRQQREEDYRRANEAIDAIIDEEEEAKGCLSSTRTPSHTTKARIKSSARK
jgi:hypothetical protein